MITTYIQQLVDFRIQRLHPTVRRQHFFTTDWSNPFFLFPGLVLPGISSRIQPLVVINRVADHHSAIHHEEAAVLRDVCAERLHDLLHGDHAAVDDCAGVLELVFLSVRHVVEDVGASVAVDAVCSDDSIRLCGRAVFEVEDQTAPFPFRSLVIDIHKPLVKVRPPRWHKLNQRIEKLGAVHRTLTSPEVRRHEHSTSQLAFRLTITNPERGLGRLLLVSGIHFWTEQLEGSLGVFAHAYAGADLAELVGCFVDLDGDVGVFA